MAFNVNFGSINQQDIINGINGLVGHKNKYKLYIDFKNHVQDYDNKGADNSQNDFGGLEVFGNGGHLIQLPVNPEKLGVNNEADTETVSILGLGEVNLLKGSHLKTISIESFFPNTYRTLTLSNNISKIKQLISFISPENNFDTGNVENITNLVEGLYRMSQNQIPPYVNAKFIAMSHQEFKNLFVSALENNTVVKFVATGANINMLMTIEKFDWDIRGGDDDIWFSLDLKEYKPFKYHKVGDKAAEYCIGDTVRYKPNASLPETVGTIEKIEVINGAKRYNIRNTAQSSENDLNDKDYKPGSLVEKIKNFKEEDHWVPLANILCKQGA